MPPGHKFGLTPLGCGWVIWRQLEDLPKDLIFDVNYLRRQHAHPGLEFLATRRTGRGAVLTTLRPPRARGVSKDSLLVLPDRRVSAAEIAPLGPFEIIFNGDPSEGIPAICWAIPEGVELGYTLYDLADRLRTHGWRVLGLLHA